MPSSYSPPDVLVTQKRVTAQATPVPPQLPVVVIGPARKIAYRLPAGDYTSGDAFAASVPELPAAAIVDPTSLHVYIDAQSVAGKELGLFEITSPDAQLSTDGTQILMSASFTLAYSLLSARNNAAPNGNANNDYGSGTPDTVEFTDNTIDFLSLGATVGDTDIVINAPASMAGSYRIYNLVGAGNAVHTVKVQQLLDADAGTFVINKSFTITTIGSVNGGAVIPGGATSVADVGLINPGGTVYDMTHANYPASPYFTVPAPTSADQVVLSMSSQSGGVVTAWNALIALAKVGDFIRVSGDSVTNANGDFKIIALNTTSHTATIQRVGQTSTGTVTAGGGSSADIKLLRVLRGSLDQNNAAGDIIEVTIGGVVTEFEVQSATPTSINVTSTISGLSGTPTATVRRGVPFRNSNASYDIIKRLSSGYVGNVLVSYQADRFDLGVNGLIALTDGADIESNLGMVHPSNPVALMADMVTRSGLADGSTTFYALVTDGSDLAAFEAALGTLETVDVYYLVPATQDKAILSLFKAHVDAQSQPKNKHERVYIGTTALTTTLPVIPPTGSLPTDGHPGVSSNLNYFGSAAIDWTLVSPGDVIKIMSDGTSTASVLESQRIFSVDTVNSRATTIGAWSSNYGGNAQVFRIDTYPFTKQQQAEDWRDYSASIDDDRVMMLRPDTVQITYTDKTTATPTDTDVLVPSYYAAAVFAGVCGANPAQQPMTNVPIPGINTLYHSNTFFTPDQLNTIAEGGNCILVQDTTTSMPYSRHQLTTDMTSLVTREWSIRKNVDFCAKYIRNSLRPYIGNKNITAEYLTQLRGIVEAIIRQLVQAGNLLAGTQLVALVQNPDEPDSVIIQIAMKVPYPANKIYVTLYF